MNIDDRITAKNLKYIRLSNGYTQEKFSNLFDIKDSALGNYERGERKVPMILVIHVCEYFGIDFVTFFSKDLSLIQKDNMKEHLSVQEAKKQIEQILASSDMSEQQKAMVMTPLNYISSEDDK